MWGLAGHLIFKGWWQRWKCPKNGEQLQLYPTLHHLKVKKERWKMRKRSPIEPKSKHSKYVLVSMHCLHSKPQLLLGRLVMAGVVLLSTDGNTPRKSSLEGWVNSLKSSEQLVGASHGWKLRKLTVDDHVECKKAHMPFQSFCNSSCTQLLSPPSSPEPHVTTCSGCNARKLFI